MRGRGRKCQLTMMSFQLFYLLIIRIWMWPRGHTAWCWRWKFSSPWKPCAAMAWADHGAEDQMNWSWSKILSESMKYEGRESGPKYNVPTSSELTVWFSTALAATTRTSRLSEPSLMVPSELLAHCAMVFIKSCQCQKLEPEPRTSSGCRYLCLLPSAANKLWKLCWAPCLHWLKNINRGRHIYQSAPGNTVSTSFLLGMSEKCSTFSCKFR